MGKDKGLVRLNGFPLIEYAIRIIKEITPDILISSNSGSFNHYGYPVIKDHFADSGPMGGIYSGLLNSGSEINLVLSCDTPFVDPDFYYELMKHIKTHDIVAPWYMKEKYEPLCAVYNRKTIGLMKSFIKKKNFKIPDLFRIANTYRYSLSDSKIDKNMFFNINNSDDLKRAEILLKSSV